MEFFREHIVYFYVSGTLFFSVIFFFMLQRLKLFVGTDGAKEMFKEKHIVLERFMITLGKASKSKRFETLVLFAFLTAAVCILLTDKLPGLGIIVAIAILHSCYKTLRLPIKKP